MPLIVPPNDYGIPEPKFLEEKPDISWEQRRRIELYLNVKSWKCPICELTNFGRNKQCADFRCRIKRPTQK